MTVTSPAGTVVTLTTDNGGSHDNVFAGTRWDDSAAPGGVPTATVAPLAGHVQINPYSDGRHRFPPGTGRGSGCVHRREPERDLDPDRERRRSHGYRQPPLVGTRHRVAPGDAAAGVSVELLRVARDDDLVGWHQCDQQSDRGVRRVTVS